MWFQKKIVFKHNDKESTLNQRGCSHILLNFLTTLWTKLPPLGFYYAWVPAYDSSFI